MTRLVFAIACCALAGTAAEAQVTNVTGTSTSSVALDGTFNFTAPGMKSQGDNGSAFASAFSSTPTEITFESGNSSSGGRVTSTSTSSVDITIKNGGSTAVAPVLESQITPAGLGFYLGDRSGGCGGDIFAGCPQTTGGQTFADLVSSTTTVGAIVAAAEFDFNVTAGNVQVYDFTGIETLTVGTNGELVANDLVLSAPNVLQGLVKLQPGGQDSALGYDWNASTVAIGLGPELAPGDSRDVVYSSTVTTLSLTDCTSSDSDVCLVTYSAFGDPIGRGGGISTSIVRRQGLGFNLDDSPESGITGVTFGPDTFAAPTFENGVLKFAPFGASVPEPKTWMSLILGFSFIGAALRRRRILSYT